MKTEGWCDECKKLRAQLAEERRKRETAEEELFKECEKRDDEAKRFISLLMLYKSAQKVVSEFNQQLTVPGDDLTQSLFKLRDRLNETEKLVELWHPKEQEALEKITKMQTAESDRDEALARVEEFNMECKRLLDSSLGKEFRSEGQKIKSARKNLRRLMSLPTTGAADRLRIEGMEYLYESVLYDDCPKCKKPPETRDCVYDIIRSRIAKLEKGEKK
jgi:hypothetical protein